MSSENARYREPLVATILVTLSVIIGIGAVEAGNYLYQWAAPPLRDFNKQIIFFDGPDSVFQNRGANFSYVPNAEILNQTIYYSEQTFSTEYEYKFKTNNFGLVQDMDLRSDMRSMLVLGDFFTEGLGAEPWFRQIAPQIQQGGYQPINGGLVATGFLQWFDLEQLLTENEIIIDKLVIIFISNDLQRPRWNFSEAQLDCLRSLTRCKGDEGFLRRPPAADISDWVAKIRSARRPKESIKDHVKSALPATYAAYRYVRDAMTTNPNIAHNYELVAGNLAKLIEKYGRHNLLFIQLPQRQELNGHILPGGVLTRKLLREAGIDYVDGISRCGLRDTDYFARDSHPNRYGYSKIAECVSQIIKPFLTLTHHGN